MTPQRKLTASAIMLLAAGLLVLSVSPEAAFSTSAKVRLVATQPPLATSGAALASLEASSGAIAADEPFSFTGHVTSAVPIEYLQVRFRLYRESGRLIFQRTRIVNRVQPGDYAFVFNRDTDDLDLAEGVYPAEMEVVMQTADGKTTDTVTSSLLVFDNDKAPSRVAIVARVSGPPLTDPDGALTSDPAAEHEVLDSVDELVQAATNERLPLTLSIPPMLLEEWQNIADGYTFANDTVAPDEPTPAYYGAVLSRLRTAIDGGHLELLSAGYSDPDLTQLAAADLVADVPVQYRHGRSVSSIIGLAPSVGTAPALWGIPQRVLPGLAAEGVEYVVISGRYAVADENTATPGAYQANDSTMTILVADEAASQMLKSNDGHTLVQHVFQSHRDDEARPIVLVKDVGADGTDSILSAARLVESQPWLRLVQARTMTNAGRTPVSLVAPSASVAAPNGYWADVVSSRSWAQAVRDAGGPQEAVLTADRQSLVSESSIWAVNGWAKAELGSGFARAAIAGGQQLLDPISLSISPIQLSGNSGSVPVTLRNDSEIPLTVRVRVSPSSDLDVNMNLEQTMQLRPQDNFFEVPVTVRNALAGELKIAVYAGQQLLDEQTVDVRASYLDRLVLIGTVVVLLVVLLIFIVARVRSHEATNGATKDGGRYTESEISDSTAEENERP